MPTKYTPYNDIYCADINTIIISCEEGIFKTEDRGLTWSKSIKENSDPIIEFCFLNNQTGWAVGNDLTILKTSDGGDTWITQKESASNTIDLNSVYFVDLNKGWAVGENGTILYTGNGGENWNAQISTTIQNLKSVHFADSQNGYCIGSDIVLKTTDGGAVWDSITNITGLNEPIDVFCFDADTCIIIAEKSPGSVVYKTTDGGSNWTQSILSGWPTELDFVNSMLGYMVGRCGHGTYSCDAWGSCSWSDYDMAIWKTENGGISWDRTILANTNNSLLDVSITDDNIVCASGTDGYMIQITNNGSTYTQISKGTVKTLYSGQFINSEIGYAVGEDGVILVTADGGDNWIQQTSGISSDLYSIRFTNADTGWAVGAIGRIRKTVNKGVTWKYQYNEVSWNLYSACFTNSLTGYVAGSYGTILKTIDGGNNWTPQASLITDDLFSIYFIDVQTGWAVGESGIILKTINGGDTWIQQTSNTDLNLNAVYFKDDMEGWAFGASGVILKTMDGGTTWVGLHSGLSTDLKSIYFLDENTGWIVGSNGIIIRTTDGGNSWAISEIGDSYSLNSVYFSGINTGWVFGNNGLILKTINGGGTYIPLPLYPVPQLLYPENNSTKISYNPVLYWESMSNALSYRLQVSRYSSFTSPIVDESSIIDTSYSLSGLDEDKLYFWRVGVEYEDEIFIWSSSYSFATIETPPSAPSLYSPDNGAEDVDRITTLSWSEIFKADTYHVQVSERVDFATLVFEDSTLTKYNSFSEVGPLDELTTYYWRVRAKNTGGISPYSDVYSFTTGLNLINPPSLNSPENGSEGVECMPTLSWYSSSGVIAYHLQVSERADFATLVFEDSTITKYNTSSEVGPLDEYKTYYWHVRVKKDGGISPYSEVYSFTTGLNIIEPPSLYDPSNGERWQPTTLNLSWNWDSNVEAYQLQVSLDIYFTELVFNDSTIAYTEQQIGPLEKATTYYWRVRSKKETGISPYSEIYCFTTESDNWHMQSDYCTNSLYFYNENLGWAVGYSMIRTKDGGTTWEDIADGYYGLLKDIYFADSLNGWAVGCNGAILKTNNSGDTWEIQNSGVDYNLYSVFFLDSSKGWAVGENGVVYTDNGGDTWNSQYNENYVYLKDVYFFNENIGIAAGIKIYKTTDGGTNWEECAIDGNYNNWCSINSLCFVDENTGWAVGDYIYKTTDGGNSWLSQNSIINAGFNDVFFIDELHGWIAGYSGIIIKTTDGGNTWNFLYSEISENIEAVYFVNQDIGWIAVECNIIKTETGGGEICALSVPILSSPYDGSYEFPEKITLSWDAVPNASSYRLQVSKSIAFIDPVFDLEGLTSTSQPFSDLDTGMVYYWRANASNASDTSFWSEIRKFTTYKISLTSPILITPSDGSIENPLPVTCSWNESADAYDYCLQVDDDPEFGSLDYESNISSTEQQIYGISGYTTYYWRVRASNYIGDTSPWSDVWGFTTGEGLSSPILSTPINNATDISLISRLSWNEVESADHYYLQVDDDPGFSSPVCDLDYISFAYYWVADLINNTTYYWRVRAYDGDFNSSSWSETWTFTTTSSVGINELNSHTQLKLYPNPAHDILFFEGFENELTIISILSMNGELLKQINEKGIKQINLSDLQDGVYLIKIINSKTTFITRIVKQ
jgi:photosystem II stability/assembly factor-like uncharacterized protein